VNFHVRDFRPADFDRLHAIDQDCFPPAIAYSRRELAHYIKSEDSFTLVAETGTPPAIAGFIVARKNSKGLGHIITVDAVSKYRRSGLGTLLITHAEQRLESAGCKAVFLETAVDNMAAIALYKKLDYFILKTLPRYYRNEMDAFLLVKRLPGS
jgi:ribosomal protein S18 acetylase RimI-like enzyme